MALVLARELLQLPMAVLYRASTTLRRWLRYDFRASVLGKAATVAQFAAVSALIIDIRAAWPLAVLAFALGLCALADYIRRAIIISRRRLLAEERKSS
jgi:phosphatidylglycerophosphate synthase